MKYRVSYEEYKDLLDELIALIELTGRHYKYIYGIPRGGLPIAVHLAHHLNAKLIMRMDLMDHYLYTERTREFLAVDDICDTGKTFKSLKGRYDTAALFYKPDRSPGIKPVYYVRETDQWIVFPWERDDEIPNREGYE